MPNGFLPRGTYDVHAHLYRKADLGGESPSKLITRGPDTVGHAVWRNHMVRLLGESAPSAGLFFPFPTAEVDVESANAFLFDELTANPESRGLALVSPDPSRSSKDSLERLAGGAQFAGIKPYHVFAARPVTSEARIGEFLPEWALEMANEGGWVVMLHIVRSRASADPANQRDVRRVCETYPNARFVLAHAARGFNGCHTAEGIGALGGLDNVWFDSSAICEPTALLAVLDAFGPTRLLWGSDFPVSLLRGRAVSLGDAFFWIDSDTSDFGAVIGRGGPTVVGVESLRALHEAADGFGLNSRDVGDVFFGNARRLLGLDSDGPRTAADWYARARRRIPGGVHLLSKSPTRYAPGAWPAHFTEARGCETWDVEGRRFYDMSTNGIGSCLLGFRDPDVTRAVRRRINLGGMSSLSPTEEVELAERLVDLHPWAEEVRLSRAGGETAAIAVRIARATTDRSIVAVCGYHGWHDWYLAANLGDRDALRGHLFPGLDPLGVPRELRGTTFHFAYGDREGFDRVVSRTADRLAAVVMEPCRRHDPPVGFLEHVRARASEAGALLIFDEITIGFRLAFGGAHMKFGVEPDMAIYAKALGNGHPIGAVVGSGSAMRGAHESFISSTYWTEGVGPAAALATLDKLEQLDAPAHIARIGGAVQRLWRDLGAKHGLPLSVDDGYPCLAHFRFDHKEHLRMSALFTTLMLAEGFLAAPMIYPTTAHTDEIVGRYGEATDRVFARIARVLDDGSLGSTTPIESGFRRLVT